MSDAFNKEDYEIGNANNWEVMIITIPLRKWAEDKQYGEVKMSGVFRMAERTAFKVMQIIRQEKAASGIVAPNGGVPLRPA